MATIKEEKALAALTLAAHCTTLTDLAPHIIARHVQELQKIASSLHKRYEAACSYSYADTDAYRKRTLNLERKALDPAEALGLYVEYQTDPRGWPLILSSGSGSSHDADKFTIRLA